MTLRFATTLCAAVYFSGSVLASAGEATDALTNNSPLSNSDLAVQRARGSGETINIGEINAQINNLDQNAKLDHNIVESSVTGSNTVSNGAFAGASGFATVIQNSGNNVIIQDATIVNYSVHQ
jgi:hypothetical protein